MGYKAQISEKIVAAIESVTIANGYSQDIKLVQFDKIRLNITDYQDFELPAVQIIDMSKLFNHEMSRSKSSWFLAIELCMRTTEQIGVVDQKALWDLEEDIMRSIMKTPKLGLNFVLHCKMVDSITDLHLQAPNYVSTLGIEIMYYEPITRDNC